MSITPPPILETTRNNIFERLKEMAPHFTPEWSAPEEDPGTALVKIFSFLTQETMDRLNQTPKRNMLAFLDLLGIRLAPKTPAEAYLRFQVSDAAPGPIDIPARTLATAASEAGELPFETDEPIRANPGKVSGLFAVDPEHDAIYQPPAGFLEKEFVSLPAASYETAAFSSAGSNSIQLQLVDGIEPGDTLRIGNTDFVVGQINGLILQLEQALITDVNPGTPVLKRTTFELFNGINHQEHILYLSHPEYFKLKEKAIITLEVKATQTGDKTEVAWECLMEDPRTKTAIWTKLAVVHDYTSGLSRGGRIELIKPVGEIKEDEIGGHKGLWIRARRLSPIALLDRLSKLDSVAIKVSAEGSIAAEAGFYNESSLSVSTPQFYPLGFEPQLFDRFQIASSEAFSKHGAEVALTFEMDMSRLLGAPAVAIGASQTPRAFTRGVLTRLVEVAFTPRRFFDSKNAPPQIVPSPGAIPAVAQGPNSELMGVFVRCQDEAIHLFRSSSIGAQDGWTILDKPGGSTKVVLDPAVLLVNGEWILYAVADNKLWRKAIPVGGGAGTTWDEISDSGFNPASAPAAALDAAGHPVVFVFDDKNKLWRVDPVPKKVLMVDQEQYECETANLAHPFAVNGFSDHGAAVFFRNRLGGIVGVRSDTQLLNLDTPTATAKAAADPSCILQLDPSGSPHHLTVFAPFGGDGQLYSHVIEPDLSPRGGWGSHGNPQPVAGRPFAVRVFETHYWVFAASSQSSMLLLKGRTEKGLIGALMLFQQDVSLTHQNTRFIRLNPTDPSELPLELKEPFHAARVAMFKLPVANAPDPGTPYHLLELLDSLTIDQGSTLQQIKLAVTTNVAGAGLWCSVDTAREVAEIQMISGSDTIQLVSALANAPNRNDTCRIFRLLDQGTTPLDASWVLLDSNARPESSAYVGADIKIKNSLVGIETYDGSTRIAKLKSSIPVTNGDAYEFPEQWDQKQDPSLDDIDPVLSWEYWNGTGWVNLTLGKIEDPMTREDFPGDDTRDLIQNGAVRFVVPDDIAPTEIAGQTNYWIRARLIGGNYGEIKFETNSTIVSGVTTYTTERRDLSRPPIVAGPNGLRIHYRLTKFTPPKVLQTLNNLNYVDQTAASATSGKSFQPFLPLDEQEKALYLGLERPFSDPSLLLAVKNDQPLDEQRKLIWEALSENDFREIVDEDESGALTHTGLVRLVAPFPPEERHLLGTSAYWVRARLLQQDWPQSPELAGLFLNAARAKQLRTVEEEILGGSDGTPQQRFQMQYTPVFEQEVRVRTVLTHEDRIRIRTEDGQDAVFDITDENQAVIETWVLWKEVPEFFNSKFDSRHYRLDHASGELEFGDGRNGAIPPIGGDNIRAFQYRYGGGKAGNVGVTTIQSLVTAIGGIDAVSNPLPAGGGSEEATREQMLDLGPAQLNHRGRAVSSSDYEWLALEASREVVKARCEPNRDSQGLPAPGWVSVYIVARSEDAQPIPPLELCRATRAYLLKQAPAVVGWHQHIFVGQPNYVPVSVTITVEAASIALAAQAETKTRTALGDFLHPLKGGPEGTGWEFGQGLAISALYAEIERISAVDHVISVSIEPVPNAEDYLELQPNQILASGNHSVAVKVAEEAQAWR